MAWKGLGPLPIPTSLCYRLYGSRILELLTGSLLPLCLRQACIFRGIVGGIVLCMSTSVQYLKIAETQVTPRVDTCAADAYDFLKD